MDRQEIRAHIRDQSNIVLNQSAWNQVPLLTLFMLSIPLCIYCSLAFSWAIEWFPLSNNPSSISLPLPFFALLTLVIGAKLLHLLYDTRLILCADYVMFIEGLVDWKEESLRVDYAHIREIEIDQTLLQKLFRVGDITLVSNVGHGGKELHMVGLRNPRKIKDIIQERMHPNAE